MFKGKQKRPDPDREMRDMSRDMIDAKAHTSEELLAKIEANLAPRPEIAEIDAMEKQAAEREKRAAEWEKQSAEWKKQAAEREKQTAEEKKRTAELEKKLDKQAAELEKQKAEIEVLAAAVEQYLARASGRPPSDPADVTVLSLKPTT